LRFDIDSTTLRRKAGQKRGAAWSDDETRLLLSMCEEKSVAEQLDYPHVNNVGIYKYISDENRLMNKYQKPVFCVSTLILQP
jgi:hypothetical protein